MHKLGRIDGLSVIMGVVVVFLIASCCVLFMVVSEPNIYGYTEPVTEVSICKVSDGFYRLNIIGPDLTMYFTNLEDAEKKMIEIAKEHPPRAAALGAMMPARR